MPAARLWNQQQLGYVPHTSVDGEEWTCITPGVVTTQGNAGGTTFTASQFSGNAADDFNGRYWVEMTSGTAKGEWARIVDDDGSGVLTLEDTGFSAQIDAADEFRLWTSPEPVIVCDGGTASTTQFNDDYRDEADDFWVDYYVVPITGTHRGLVRKITAWDVTGGASEGLFTTDAFPSALATGDVCLIRRFVEISPPSPGLTEPYIPRPGQRVNFARGDGARGPRGGTFGFNSQVYASGALTTSGNSPAKSVLHGLMQACGYAASTPTTMAVATSNSTTTVITVTVGHHARVSIGDAVMWNGQVAWVTDKQDDSVTGVADTVTVSPAFNAAPAAADLIYALRTFNKSTTGDELGVTLEWEVDGVRTTLTGCKGNVSFQEANPIVAAFAFSVDHYVEQYAPAPYNAADAYVSVQPVLDQDRKAWLSAVATSISGLTFSLNAAVVERAVQGASGINGRSSYQFTDFPAGGTFRELLASADTDLPQLQRWYGRTAMDLMVQMGSHANSFAMRVPVARLVERPGHQDEGGLVAVPEVFEAQDAGSQPWDSDDDAVDDTVTKIPDMAIAFS